MLQMKERQRSRGKIGRAASKRKKTWRKPHFPIAIIYIMASQAQYRSDNESLQRLETENG